jgi:aryl-alcohol dehydrogenase-like predicted oxidoreductase
MEHHRLTGQLKRMTCDHYMEMGIRLIAYSPLAMGMLTGKYTANTSPVSDGISLF